VNRKRTGSARPTDGFGAADSTQPRVLVVDGDESVLRLLEIKLSKAGFTVGTVADGEAGYVQARASGVDLVIAGDALGPIDSHSLVRELRDLPSPPAIIVLSSEASPEAIARALRAGCDDYVLKPYSPHELVHRIEVTLLRRKIAAEASGYGRD